MPTVLRIGPYRFFFYSNEWQEPVHIHAQRDKALAKFWFHDVSLANSSGFSASELSKLAATVREHR
jgi:hypothetical protein